MPPDKPKVDVIDDDDAVRDSLALVLSSAGISVRVHASATAFLADGAADPADCIVTDVRMPGMTGIDLLRELRIRGINTPVIVVTGHGDVPLAVEAMKLGALEFLEKPFDDRALLDGVARASAGISRQRDHDVRLAEITARISSLSERERQVMNALVEGRPNKVIAFELGISPRTVEVYRANVMTKMQAGSLPDLLRMVFLAIPPTSAAD